MILARYMFYNNAKTIFVLFMDREISKEEKQKRRNKMILRIAIAVAVCVAIVAFIFDLSQAEVKRSDINIAIVGRGDIEPSLTGSGTVVPSIQEMITCPINSQIKEIYHHSGDAVDEGTPLLRLDLQSAEDDYQREADQLKMRYSEFERLKISNKTYLDDLAMKVKVAAMKLDRLEAELRNERYLDSLGSGTHDKVKEVEFSCNTSRLELEQLRQQFVNERKMKAADEREKQLVINVASRNLAEIKRTLEDAQIRSPRKAIITEIVDEVGAQVSQGSKIAVVSDLSHFRVDGTIADAYGEYVQAGGKVIVKIGNENMEGTVGSVNPLSKNGVIHFTVMLKDDNHKRLRSGLRADIFVVNSIKENVLRLPNSSFYVGAGEYSLFVEENDELVKRVVELGESSYDYVEVVSGLKEGDQVVISDMKRFKSNKTVGIK